MAKKTEKQVSEEFNSILKIFTEQGNEVAKATELAVSAKTVTDQLQSWKKSSKIVVTDVSQINEMTQARTARLAIKNDRVGALKFIAAKRAEVKERMNADLKEDKGWLKLAQYIESEAKDIETTLEVAEKFKETFERKQREELAAKRLEEMEKVCEDAHNYPLGDMSEESYQSLLEGLTIAKQAKDRREAEEAAAEQARLAKIKKLQGERSLQLDKYKNFGTYTDITKLGELSAEDWEKVFEDKKKGYDDNEKRIAEGIQKGLERKEPVTPAPIGIPSSLGPDVKNATQQKLTDKQQILNFIRNLTLPPHIVLKDPKFAPVQTQISVKFEGFKKWAKKEIQAIS